jgi:hydroxymethylglutaryl-CoA lyase
MSIDIEISEVGPRDGLQSIDSIMPLAAKQAWIRAEAEAGVPEIEVGSFVSSKLLPQLADTAAVVEYAIGIPNLTVAVLVPNARGAAAALKAGAHKLTLPLSVSETHSLKNLKRSHEQVLAEVRAVRAMIDEIPTQERPKFEGSLSTAFGCTIEGSIAQDEVVRLAAALMEAGADEVGISDTTGYGNPTQVRAMAKAIWAEVGKDNLTGIHLHNTRGQGLANALAAVESGINSFESSFGELGGCPVPPGSTGNVSTEDLVSMLSEMGIETGIDLPKLLEASGAVQELLGRPLGAHLLKAGPIDWHRG